MPLLLEAIPCPDAEAPPCAYQACPRPAAAYPVVQLPPPALARNGQPLRVVFRRSPVCDSHRRPMLLHLIPRLQQALDAYCAGHALPVADWDAARWEWQPVEEGNR